MYTIQELLEGYKNKTFSPVEITKTYLERAKQHANLNAFISITEETAIRQAEIAEVNWHKGLTGRLEGIPLSYKDNFHTKGIVSTSGSKVDEHFIPDKNAAVINELNREGAIMLGKNNMHEFAFGITSNNPFYGPVKNPWDNSLTPGGSSGGSAVAVAADLSVASMGTDTGGSIRIPAASCGLVGLKPTRDLLPASGLTLLSWTLDHAGPITRNVSDLIIMMEALTDGNVSNDTYYHDNLRDLKVGVPTNFFTEQMEDGISDKYQETLKNLEALGANLIEIKVPETPPATAITPAIGITEAGFIHRERMEHHAKLYGSDVQALLNISKSFPAVDYIQAQEHRKETIRELDTLLEHVDIIAAPTIPAMPKKIGQEEITINGIKETTFDCMTRFASIFNLTGHPAINMPAGMTNDLPVGVQFISNKWKEHQLLNISKVYEDNFLSDFYKVRKERMKEYQ